MWVISRDGFVSLVAHRDDPNLLRARARRREHLVATFGLGVEIEDLGIDAPDYRWHANVTRDQAIEALMTEVNGIDYESHAKDEISQGDPIFHSALMRCWYALHTLQDPPFRDEGI